MDTSDYVRSGAIQGQFFCNAHFRPGEVTLRLKREPSDPKFIYEAYQKTQFTEGPLFWMWGIWRRDNAPSLPFGVVRFCLLRTGAYSVQPSRDPVLQSLFSGSEGVAVRRCHAWDFRAAVDGVHCWLRYKEDDKGGRYQVRGPYAGVCAYVT